MESLLFGQIILTLRILKLCLQKSLDNDTTFGEVRNLSNHSKNSNNQEISVSDENVYVVWQDTNLWQDTNSLSNKKNLTDKKILSSIILEAAALIMETHSMMK
jgi:hypothetical protein